MRNRATLATLLTVLILVFLLSSEAFAELKIDSVYPTMGVVGQDLDVKLRGSGFDQNTRVSMSLDVGHKKEIVGSVDTPGSAYGVAVSGDRAYVADGDSGLKIIDISNPQGPQIIGSVDTTGNARNIAIAGNMAYVADGDSGLLLIDVSNPASPEIVGSENTYHALDVATVDNTAYVTTLNNGLLIIDISNPQSLQIIGSVDTPGSAGGVAVAGGMAYVADGMNGLQIIDISNSQSPQIVGSVAGVGDYTLDVSVKGQMVYAAGGYLGLYVIDVSNPQSPQIIGSLNTSGVASGVCVDGSTAYVADSSGGLKIIDIDDPIHPVLVGAVDTPGFANGVAIAENTAYVAAMDSGLQAVYVGGPKTPQVIGMVQPELFTTSVAVSGETAFMNDYGSGAGIYNIINITDTSYPQGPQIIGSVEVPGNIDSMKVKGDYLYVEGGGGLQVIDISNPQLPQVIKTRYAYGNGITIVGNMMYVGGLYIFDISNPRSPIAIGSLDTPLYSTGISVVGDKAYVVDGRGLHVIDISNPQSPQVIGSVETPGSAQGVVVSGNMAYVADGMIITPEYEFLGNSDLQVIDVSDPKNPLIVNTVQTLGGAEAQDIFMVDNLIYVAIRSRGIQVFDISNPSSPQMIGSVGTLGEVNKIVISDGKAYVADGHSGLVIVPVPIEILPVNVINETNISLTLPSPIIAGHYSLRVFNASESFEAHSAVTFLTPENYDIQNRKKAIIVAGGGDYAGNPIWKATQLNANYAYRSLLTQGYKKDNIYFLSSDANVDPDGDGQYNDVEANLNYANLSYAITNWARDANELILYMVDHGGNQTFQLDAINNLNAIDLDSWLDNLQTTMTGKVIFIYDACQSGSFLSAITPLPGREKDRIIIASAKTDEPAWFINDGVLSFSYQFWASVFFNANIYDSFSIGKLMMSGEQTVLLDANGNGIPNENNDFLLAKEIVICRGRLITSSPPIIGQISGIQNLNGETTAAIFAKDIFSKTPIKRVWAVINPPGFDRESLGVPVTDYPTIDLTDSNNDGIYEGFYEDFTRQGTYKISIFVQDEEDLYSLPKQTTVVQAVGNSAPTVLASPVGGLFNSFQLVHLTPSDETVTIYYTFGDTPTLESQLYTNPIEISSNTTLKYIAFDDLGNQSQIYSQTYEIDLVPPEEPFIDTSTNVGVGNIPYPLFVWEPVPDAAYYILQYADTLDFNDAFVIPHITDHSYEVTDPLRDYGTWFWRVMAVDLAGNKSNWSLFQYKYEDDSLIHKAIVVKGGGTNPGNALWDSFETVSKYSYNVLSYQGYAKSDIYFLSSSINIDLDNNGIFDDVDGLSTKNDLLTAITQWAQDADDLLIFLVGPGNDGFFQMNESEELYASELDTWIDQFQENTPEFKGKVYVIYDANNSGSFIPLLTPTENKGRIVITSTAGNQSAMFLNNGALSFSYQFWAYIFYKALLYDSYVIGKNMVLSGQNPLIDANGNGMANEKADRVLSDGILIGLGRQAASVPPVIQSVTNNQYLNGNTAATFWVGNIIGLNNIKQVIGVITTPGFDQSSGSTPVTDLPIIDMVKDEIDGTYKGAYTEFNQPGVYNITIYATDTENLYSLPVHTTVTQLDGLTPSKGDINGDGTMDLIDAILVLKAFAGIDAFNSIRPDYIASGADVNEDGKVGLEEVVYILQEVSGLR